MEIREISFYKQFRCTGGDCRHTCCRGWMIPLTKEDTDRFGHEKGRLKFSLLTAVSQKDIVCFNKGSGKCPFHNKEGLCSLQLMKGHDFIPEACRMFPRFYRNYVKFEEHYIDPACTEAAGLLLKNAADLKLLSYEGDQLSDPCTCNDDNRFLGEMVNTRKAILGRLNGVTEADTLNLVFNDIYTYSSKLQQAFLTGNTGFLSDCPFDDFHAGEDLRLFPLDTAVLGSIMNTSFYHKRLKHTNPFLYRLCRLYFDRYRSIMNSSSSWDCAVRDFINEHKEAVHYCTAYYTYYLYLYFLKSFEDYSFLKNAALGMIHTNMIFMFSLLLSLDEPGSYPQSLPSVISMYDRRACFNDEIMNEMYGCLDRL